ncbi:hypothetical protein MIR68_010025 [Amoeboaphelidium protococcarum]|nr:hypothetical protein MIR68_010025 [Amoeboaphelidium protococcarum]
MDYFVYEQIEQIQEKRQYRSRRRGHTAPLKLSDEAAGALRKGSQLISNVFHAVKQGSIVGALDAVTDTYSADDQKSAGYIWRHQESKSNEGFFSQLKSLWTGPVKKEVKEDTGMNAADVGRSLALVQQQVEKDQLRSSQVNLLSRCWDEDEQSTTLLNEQAHEESQAAADDSVNQLIEQLDQTSHSLKKSEKRQDLVKQNHSDNQFSLMAMLVRRNTFNNQSSSRSRALQIYSKIEDLKKDLLEYAGTLNSESLDDDIILAPKVEPRIPPPPPPPNFASLSLNKLSSSEKVKMTEVGRGQQSSSNADLQTSISNRLKSSEPYLRKTNIQRSPGGTPIRKPSDGYQGPGKDLILGLQRKFKSICID